MTELGIAFAPYPAYSDAELKAAVDHGHDGAGNMAEELKRRQRVYAGDTSVMTKDERQRWEDRSHAG